MIVAVPVLIALAGCTQLGLDDGAPRADDTCGAGKLNRFRGVPASDEVFAEMGTIAGKAALRVIRPGDAVTMDFRPDRINVELGAGGRVERLRCG